MSTTDPFLSLFRVEMFDRSMSQSLSVCIALEPNAERIFKAQIKT